MLNDHKVYYTISMDGCGKTLKEVNFVVTTMAFYDLKGKGEVIILCHDACLTT